MKKKLPNIFFSFLFAFYSATSFTQTTSSGTPFIRNYLPEEYKAEIQNWAIVQDQRGIMYFANNSGVLEYDGVNWRKTETPSAVRSLAKDKNGRVFVGLISDFGFLQADKSGIMHYVSLKEKIPEKQKGFNDVWETLIVDEKVIFTTRSKLFLLKRDSISVLLPDEEFANSFLIRNTFYVREFGKGILYLDDNRLRLMPGSKKFADNGIPVMLPYEKDKILFYIRTKGIYIFSKNRPDGFSKPPGFEKVNKFLTEDRPYCGTVLPNGDFAIGTRTSGIVVFDKSGNIRKHYNKQNGLQDNTIIYLHIDHNGQIWAGLANGISLIQNNLPFINYTVQEGLEGNIHCAQSHKSQLYIGTEQYLYLQKESGNFDRIEGTRGQNWHLYKAKNKLLLANNGIFKIKDKQLTLITQTEGLGVYVFCSIAGQSEYLLSGLQEGLLLLEYKNEHWQFKHFIKGFDKSVYALTEDTAGNFWASSIAELYKLRLNETFDSTISVQVCTNEQFNIPAGWVIPYKQNTGEIVFGTQKKGIYRYLPDENSFEPHPDFSTIKEGVYPFIQDKSGNIWFDEWMKDGSHEKGVLSWKNGKYEMYKTPFYKFIDREIPNTFALYPQSDSLVYFGTNKGLLAYYPKQDVNYDIPFNTLIRKVLVGDTLLYGGASKETLPKLEYEKNNLTFHYAATFYEDSEKNLYSYRLIGLDTAWSAWTKDTKKEYTNLHEGDYRFEVKSKNIYRKIGRKTNFSFTIDPPWQRTRLAYGIYSILAIALVWFIVRINTRRLKKDKEKLEQIVKKRTEELSSTLETVNQQKEEIETQAVELKAQTEELKTTNDKLVELDDFKQGMTGMIVHDLKNPLNGIINISKSYSLEKQLFRTKQIGKQILNMVLNILDVHKYEETKMIVDKLDHSLLEISQDAINNVAFLSEQKNIAISNSILQEIIVKADKEIVKRIIVNILTNAIKYTPNNGDISLSAIKNPDSALSIKTQPLSEPAPIFRRHKATDRDSQVLIKIADTGQGIPQDQLHKVFDKFGQVSAKKSGKIHSTGLGLTFCKMAVEAHGGEIGVESEVENLPSGLPARDGKIGGATFWFTLPTGKISGKIKKLQDAQKPAKDVRHSVISLLTADDKKILEPFVLQFRKYDIYDISILRKLLKQIEEVENERIKSWKEEISKAIRSGNEKRYRELISTFL